ncbi:uncharacterized protein PpBr36_10859 [Pyricularia pennisetigena]|uniref:uncharacterized protein n=1 Tax=Pyricularia pennisetigena TaxID=1578925 RepID=UPI00114EC1B0|nr:uncharacterized protein PpBr36_10859 [Pyricularia pennisetigena]TLS21054.1 hypothetical protein PpBr36_10859 [Pyricularia pennisetigena]
MMGSETLRGTAKLSAVKGLLDCLTLDLKEHNLSSQERDVALEQLKVYGRDPRDADPIFTKEGISTLAAHSFDGSSDTISRNALRCLANAMLLQPSSRQEFVDLGYHIKACAKLASDSWDDEFLISRVLMLAANARTIDHEVLITKHGLADLIAARLERHVDFLSDECSSSNTIEGMALSETLKMMFAFLRFCPKHSARFTGAAGHILTLICQRPLPAESVLDPPFGPLINALCSLDLKDKSLASSLFPKRDPTHVISRLINILDRALGEFKGSDMDDATITLLAGSLCVIFEVAPEPVRIFMQARLLPTDEDRKEVLGRTESLPSKLLKMMTNAMAPSSRKAISHLLFNLSDKDAAKFVEKVGYGYASGFLFEEKIPVPQSALGSEGASGSTAQGRAVNPITGQFLDAEKLSDMPEMSQEEKEREAERLFVLFERLKKTGIIDVQNPVEKAFQEGRFEELEEDEDDGEENIKKAGPKYQEDNVFGHDQDMLTSDGIVANGDAYDEPRGTMGHLGDEADDEVGYNTMEPEPAGYINPLASQPVSHPVFDNQESIVPTTGKKRGRPSLSKSLSRNGTPAKTPTKPGRPSKTPRTEKTSKAVATAVSSGNAKKRNADAATDDAPPAKRARGGKLLKAERTPERVQSRRGAAEAAKATFSTALRKAKIVETQCFQAGSQTRSQACYCKSRFGDYCYGRGGSTEEARSQA